MQPYFFPYLGHFLLIAAVDEWIVFDITQYTPKSWMNRNRILHPNNGWQYATVPLSNSSISIKTHEARILDIAAARAKILGKLDHYKKKAPYFFAVNQLVEEVFESINDDSLVSLNVQGLKKICEYLQIPFNFRICSELELELPEKLPAGAWALEISSQLGASSYLNPKSGAELFDWSAFDDRGISLQFIETLEFTYETGPYQFERNLSIIDVLMWNSPEAVKDQICRNLQSSIRSTTP